MSDPVLQNYLHATGDEETRARLLALLFDSAEPIVLRIVNSRLRTAPHTQHREDLTAEVILDLIHRLQDLKAAPAADGILNFAGYVATVAHHACDRYFRQRFPQRHRLKNRLRYLASNDPRFSLWTDSSGELICGLAAWQGAAPVPQHSTIHVQPGPTDKVAAAILRSANGPLRLDDLVNATADCLGITDHYVPLESVAIPSPSAVDPAQAIDQRRWLATLWPEILLLPLTQRIALLLHLRDERGGPALPYFPASGVATISAIAAALEMTLAELVALWPNLPLSDLAIAERLGLTRQQVINLRASARQRLARKTTNISSFPSS